MYLSIENSSRNINVRQISLLLDEKNIARVKFTDEKNKMFIFEKTKCNNEFSYLM